MTAQQIKTDWGKAAIPAVISFFLGIMINSFTSAFTYAQKVDLLTQKVAEMSVSIEKLTDKLETRDDRFSNIESRVSVLEEKLKK